MTAGSGGGADTLVDEVAGQGLIAPGKTVIVLYSGGRDSTCLLDVAVRIAGSASVAALHVNYGLRAAAAADERHCFDTCERLGVPIEVHRPRKPEGGNVQAWARDERYATAAALAKRGNADVAAGHTATDQVETILYRLASSPSRRALLGMRPREGNLVRPLLLYTRARTGAYCEERGLAWREDESNAGDAYARSRIRAKLVPALNDVHPAAEANVLALASILRDEADVLDALVDDVLAGTHEIALPALRALPEALQRLVLQRMADDAAGCPAPGTARRATEILTLPDRGTAALDLPHGVRAIADRGKLRFALQNNRRSRTHK
ncbi:MAG TPA: tRNA lysidine(34) synthetase TilS [Solirubrobacteraceae bacterium]